LLRGVLITLPLLLIRLIYGLCYFFITDPSFTTSVAAKVILSVIPEMVAVLALVLVGMNTVNMWKSKGNSSEF
jgi:hypothetical protein